VARRSAARVGQKITLGVRPMIRQQTAATTEPEIDDRSMRVVEWVIALIAAVAAGVLAFIR
jgi:hypothetical protein